MLKIGDLELQPGIMLAPMAGITDLPFRLLSRRFGCKFAFVEMINCRSISHKSRKTHQMLSSCPQDSPLGVQLLGAEPKFILRALEVLKGYKFDVLDFNAACPARKVTRRGEGASLLKDPKKLNSLLKLIVKNSVWPVTVKIRAGWDKNSLNAPEIALSAQDAGVKAVFIHGRTKQQEYAGQVDYGLISKVKRALEIPVIASGDILSAELSRRMFAETGCDGVAVARGSLGNPWIFNQIDQLLADQPVDKPGAREIIFVMQDHLQENINFFGERIGVIKFRKFFAWYTKGFRKIRHLRERVSRAKTAQEMLEIIQKCA